MTRHSWSRVGLAAVGLAVALCAVPGRAGAQSILLYEESVVSHHALNALTGLGYPYTRATASDFVTLISSGTWDLVVIDMPSAYPAAGWPTAVDSYIRAGGAVIGSCWESGAISALASPFEFQYASDHYDPIMLYRWDATHPLFNSPNAVPDIPAGTSDPWGVNGPLMRTAGTSIAVGGATPGFTDGQALIVVGNGDRTIFNGFLFDDYSTVDADVDGQYDCMELLQNEITYLMDIDVDRDADGWTIAGGDCNDNNAAVNPGVTLDPCDNLNNDCDIATPDGMDEAWWGLPCDGSDGDMCEDGIFVCMGGAQSCNDDLTTGPDLCDGIDNDCNAATVDGSGDPRVGAACDGDDTDLCAEGTGACYSGAFFCTDTIDDTPELCDGVDNDCDTSTPDGADEVWFGSPCDGSDADLCEDGAYGCEHGAQACVDGPETGLEICDGFDNDCNPVTLDGSGDDRIGEACDGDDADTCAEGIGVCTAGAYACTDDAGETPELCDGVDNDCDPSTEDGIGEAWFAGQCDGPDLDLCEEGQYGCTSGIRVCSDTTGNIEELCNAVDDDCDPTTEDGSDEDWSGEPCDGTDADLCNEGVYACGSGIQTCNDFTGDALEVCNGVDDDCDPSTAENIDSDGDGVTPCGGDCNDSDASIHPGATETCDGIDQDCDPLTDSDADGDGFAECDGDCQPINPNAYPGAAVNCTAGGDWNCNGMADSMEAPCFETVLPPDDMSGCSCSLPGSPETGAGHAIAILGAALAAAALAIARRGKVR